MYQFCIKGRETWHLLRTKLFILKKVKSVKKMTQNDLETIKALDLIEQMHKKSKTSFVDLLSMNGVVIFITSIQYIFAVCYIAISHKIYSTTFSLDTLFKKTPARNQ